MAKVLGPDKIRGFSTEKHIDSHLTPIDNKNDSAELMTQKMMTWMTSKLPLKTRVLMTQITPLMIQMKQLIIYE